MVLDGLVADFHLRGDFLVPETLGDQGYDLLLTTAEG
jgi:hypothetical protein